MGSVVAEGCLVRVLGAVVQVSLLGELVDEEPDKDAGYDALVERAAHQVQCLVVDPVHLLHTLQVILLGGGVGECPESEVVHVAKEAEVVLEGNAESLFLHVALEVRVLALGDIAFVVERQFITQVLASCPQVGKLVHLF